MEIPVTLTIVFVVFKFAGILDWSWWWIFSPLWISGIITGIMFGAFGAISSIGFIRRWGRTTVGGAFAIIGGLFSLFDGIMLMLTKILGGISVVMAILLFVVGAIALIGGGFTFKRRHWGLALSGAICSLGSGGPQLDATILGIPFRPIILVLAILAIVFVILGRREFA